MVREAVSSRRNGVLSHQQSSLPADTGVRWMYGTWQRTILKDRTRRRITCSDMAGTDQKWWTWTGTRTRNCWLVQWRKAIACTCGRWQSPFITMKNDYFCFICFIFLIISFLFILRWVCLNIHNFFWFYKSINDPKCLNNKLTRKETSLPPPSPLL